jgi:Calcineurin-like phosphoesterase
MSAIREAVPTPLREVPPAAPRRRSPAPQPAIEPERIAVRQGGFAVVGGLRSTLGFEAWRASTPRERRAILREASSEKPDFIALLGDLVFCGSSADAWLDYERMSGPLKSSGVPAYPVLGNHDYWLARRPALSNYFGHFPHLRGRHWYAAIYAGVGLIFLDSNVQWLTGAVWREQLEWYERLLAQWETDREILGVLVLQYHPAFTRRTSPDVLHVQRDLVPPFLRARKTLAMLSGLVHDDAPVFRGGKAFLAAGAAGRALSDGGRPSDETPRSMPPLRYLRVRPEGGGVAVEIRGYEPDGSGFATVGRHDLRWGPPDDRSEA